MKKIKGFIRKFIFALINVVFLLVVCSVIAIAGARIVNDVSADRFHPLGLFQKLTPTPTKEIIRTVTNSPTQVPYVPQNAPVVTQDPDPVIDCKFTYLGTLRLKRSVCASSTDCQIGGKWVFYDSVEKCKEDQAKEIQQKNGTNNNYVYPTYAPLPANTTFSYMNCNLYDAQTNQTTTLYIAISDCTNLLNEQSKKNDLYYKTKNDAQKQLNSACSDLVVAWGDRVRSFYANEYNNFSSSADAVLSLSKERDIYQQKADQAGCVIYLSLY